MPARWNLVGGKVFVRGKVVLDSVRAWFVCLAEQVKLVLTKSKTTSPARLLEETGVKGSRKRSPSCTQHFTS